MSGFSHTHAFEVRDYECDLQGIVNNANYQHYLEHARHQMLKRMGLDFAALSHAGMNLVVTRIEIDYLLPLRSGDAFEVRTTLQRVSKLRFACLQNIVRTPDGAAVAKAVVTVASINAAGRPAFFAEIDAALAGALNSAA